jgi:hypothetical protein
MLAIRTDGHPAHRSQADPVFKRNGWRLRQGGQYTKDPGEKDKEFSHMRWLSLKVKVMVGTSGHSYALLSAQRSLENFPRHCP